MLTAHGQKYSIKTTLYIVWVAAAGLTVFSAGMIRWQSTGVARFVAFLFLAQLISTQKISLPGMRGTMSTLVLCAGFSGWLSYKIVVLTNTTSPFVLLAIAAFLFLVSNTALVSVVVSLTEQKPIQKEWIHCFCWSSHISLPAP